MQRFEQKPIPRAVVVVVWGREQTRRVHCTARRIQASEPTLTVPLVWRQRDVSSALESTCLGAFMFHNVPETAAAVVYEYVSTERGARRVRFSWSLVPSPRQPTVVWPRRDAPLADRASGAKQRRYTAETMDPPDLFEPVIYTR